MVYNASNNELVRTKTLTKSTIVQIDATPFRQWYEAHYASPLARKKGTKLVSFYENFKIVGRRLAILFFFKTTQKMNVKKLRVYFSLKKVSQFFYHS